ncbi:MAG: GNAT family N-acetyltransferase [Clostridiales bacterium]|mgnify:CR=1 FL=1|nr:GNAT family N-acetyltransferase [Clostridiales bacterium]
MTDYGFARPGDEMEILDLANMVFSMADAPTDFVRLHPAVYSRPGFAGIHAVAREEGRMVAMAALKPMQVRLSAEERLACGFIGTVCTHPRHERQGHMRRLMQLLEERGRRQGMALLMLGGQRQLYQRYGYEQGATALHETLTRRNLSAVADAGTPYAFVALEEVDAPVLDTIYNLYLGQLLVDHREKDALVRVLRTWQAQGYAVLRGGQPFGYLCSDGDRLSECVLADDAKLPEVLKAWLAFRGKEQCVITLPLHRGQAIEAVGQLAGKWQLGDSLMLRVMDWPKVVGGMLRFKAAQTALQPGQAVFAVEGEGCWQITVEGQGVAVTPTDKTPDAVFSHRAAVRQFLSSHGGLREARDAFYGWLPLPFSVPSPDWF